MSKFFGYRLSPLYQKIMSFFLARVVRLKPVQVYFTQTAEWDIAGYQVSDEDLDSIIRNLEEIPSSDRDAIAGTLRIRSLRGYEISFLLSSSTEEFMIDVCGVRPPSIVSASEKAIKALEVVGTVRGGLGI